jgi:transcriptional regulator with PAS, ATPase and Fis domain
MEQAVETAVIDSTLSGTITLKRAVRKFERNLIIEALKQHHDDKQKVAMLLGISVSSLYRKLTDFSHKPKSEEQLDINHLQYIRNNA